MILGVKMIISFLNATDINKTLRVQFMSSLEIFKCSIKLRCFVLYAVNVSTIESEFIPLPREHRLNSSSSSFQLGTFLHMSGFLTTRTNHLVANCICFVFVFVAWKTCLPIKYSVLRCVTPLSGTTTSMK